MAPFNREEALRNADKALKANRFDLAITEYVRVLEYQPRDFATANLLGDVYARAGQMDNAIAQYARIAEIFVQDGFLPKAQALFKKILKARPDDEQALVRLGQIAAKQGLLADARSSLTAVAARRRARGDEHGADDILIELADADPSDQDGRMEAARILARRGDTDAASSRLRDLAIELLEKERPDEAVDVLREAVHLVPGDRVTRKQLIGLLTDLGQGEEAEVYLTRDVAAGDPAMLLALAKAELETGRSEEAREDLRAAFAEPSLFDAGLALVAQIAPRRAESGAVVADVLADLALARGDADSAVTALLTLLEGAPAHVPSALRLVEICLEQSLEGMVMHAQRALASAYAAAGQHEAARRIEEDLAAADPLGADHEAARDGIESEAAAEGHTVPEEDVVIPDFDVYVYGQPVANEPQPAEPVERAEPDSEAALIARLLAEEAAQDEPPAQPAAALPEIDLTSTLDALDEAQAEPEPAPLEEVFDGFRQRNRVEELERAEAALEEGELAAALGQIADAERLYGEAARALPFRFRAAAALGRLLMQEARVPEAIEWFERATEAPAPDAGASHALLYDLGDALERHGETMRALAIFMELNAEAGDYRGIAARVERLARAGIGG